LDVGLRISRGFLREDNLHCWYRDDGKRFVVRADEKLTAFLELELAICAMRSRPGWQKKLAWKSPPSQLSGFNNPTST